MREGEERGGAGRERERKRERQRRNDDVLIGILWERRRAHTDTHFTLLLGSVCCFDL